MDQALLSHQEQFPSSLPKAAAQGMFNTTAVDSVTKTSRGGAILTSTSGPMSDASSVPSHNVKEIWAFHSRKIFDGTTEHVTRENLFFAHTHLAERAFLASIIGIDTSKSSIVDVFRRVKKRLPMQYNMDFNVATIEDTMDESETQQEKRQQESNLMNYYNPYPSAGCSEMIWNPASQSVDHEFLDDRNSNRTKAAIMYGIGGTTYANSYSMSYFWSGRYFGSTAIARWGSLGAYDLASTTKLFDLDCVWATARTMVSVTIALWVMPFGHVRRAYFDYPP